MSWGKYAHLRYFCEQLQIVSLQDQVWIDNKIDCQGILQLRIWTASELQTPQWSHLASWAFQAMTVWQLYEFQLDEFH